MPIGNVSRDTAPKRDNYRPPWVKDKNADSPPAWLQKRLKPVEPTKTDAEETTAPAGSIAKPLKPVLRKQTTVRDKPENGVSEIVEEKLVKPSSVSKLIDKPRPSEEKSKFTKSALKSIDKIPKLEDKLASVETNKEKNKDVILEKEIKVDKLPERPALKSVRTIDEKPKEKSVTIVDKRAPEKNGFTKPVNKSNDKPVNKINSVTNEKLLNKTSTINNDKTVNKTNSVTNEKPLNKTSTISSNDKSVNKTNSVANEKPLNKTNTIINDKPQNKTSTIVNDKPLTKPNIVNEKSLNKTVISDKVSNDKTVTNSTTKDSKQENKPVNKTTEKPKVEETKKEEVKMATKPPTPVDKTPSKLPPRKPPLQKQPSKDDGPVKKWRDPLHERVKENIDKTLANDIPKGHTLTKNESLRSLLKPTPPPMPPPLPPKMPPPPEFKKAPLDPTKLKTLEKLRSRPRRRPDWTDMMKEVEEGKKLKHVVCNDRSSPIITRSTLVKNKDQSFIFESEKPNSHNDLLKEINKGVKLKKTKTNDRSKPNLEGLRKFRRQMTIEEQVQKSMSQANLAASPSGVSIAEGPGPAPTEEDEIDEMDDIDKVRDDLQSTKQLLAIELRNKEAQERENKRLQTRIQNLEAEVARERAIIRQEQRKTVISVTDAYDERLVNNLKMEVEKTKENADSLEKKYLDAAEERDTALTELEELKRQNAELEKKLQQALSGIMPTNAGSRRSSHAIKQLSITRDDSFEEEEESEPEEEESEEKKQKRMEKEVRNMRNKIRHLKEKQDNMKRERMGFKLSLKNQQAALKHEKKKYKELKREVDKMAAMMKEVGSDEDEDEEEEEESEDEKKSETEEEESETETEQDTESETESESEPEDAPLPKKKDNLTTRLKRHETRVNALKKGNALLMANVDRMKDDVLKQREESMTLQKELDSLIEDLE